MSNQTPTDDKTIWTKRNRSKHHWITAIMTMLILGGTIGMMQTASGITIVPIAEAFSVPRGTAAFYLSLTGYILSAMYLVVGVVMDKVSSRIWIPLGLAIGALGMLLCSFAQTFSLFYIAPIFMAVTEALNGGTFQGAIIANWFEKRLGFIMGLVDMVQSGIGALWGIVGSVIIVNFGWRNQFRVVGVYLLALAVLSIFLLRYRASEKGLLRYGAADSGQDVHESDNTEKKNPAVTENLPGVTIRQALKSPCYWLIMVFIAVSISTCAFNSSLPGFGMEFGMGTVLAGTLTTVSLVGRMIGSTLAGVLFDKFGMLKSSLIMIVVGMVGTFLLMLHGSTTMIFVGGFLLGSFMGVPVIGVTFVVKQFIGLKKFAILSSWGHVVMALFFSYYISMFSTTYDKTGSYLANTYLLLGFLVATAIILLLIEVTGKRLQKHWS